MVAEQFVWNIHEPGPDGVFGRTAERFVKPGIDPLGLDPADPAGRDDATGRRTVWIQNWRFE